MDSNIVARIIREIRPQESDCIIEVGPGKGAITAELYRLAGHLEVIEIDRDLISLLRSRFGESLQIHSADVMKFDFKSLYKDQPLRIVGNLPYNISTPLIFKLITESRLIKDMHLMLQKEVVDRLTSKPSTPAYGRLGIMVQYHCRVEKCFNVPPSAFQPSPKVQSAIVRLIPHGVLPHMAVDETLLQQLVTAAFTQRRKTLRNALSKLMPATQIAGADIDPSLRPENISIEEYVKLANILAATRKCPP